MLRVYFTWSNRHFVRFLRKRKRDKNNPFLDLHLLRTSLGSSLMRTERWLYWMRLGRKMGCHQMAERSFFFRGCQFPVCARCTGVILGEGIALICLLFSVDITMPVALALLIPMGIDWGLQFVKILESSNVRRLITGTLGGFGLTFCYAYMIRKIWRWLSGWYACDRKGFLIWMPIVTILIAGCVVMVRLWRKHKQGKSADNGEMSQ